MFATALALLLAATPSPPAATPGETQATLAFAIDGVKNGTGQLVLAVYTSKATWLDLSRAARVQRIAPRPGRVFAVMEGVPPGDCAVLVFHDENGNGTLDMGWLGPIEGSGASNGATGRLGPPSWEDAKMACRPGETVVGLQLGY
jgi:uncharacterized protein (DUF2141 family)